MTRKLVALVGFIIGCGGIGLFVALGIYVWSLKREVNRQAETLAGKAQRAGDEADRAITFVENVIKQANDDLAIARRHAAATARPTRPMSMFELAMARTASQRLAGSVDRARGPSRPPPMRSSSPRPRCRSSAIAVSSRTFSASSRASWSRLRAPSTRRGPNCARHAPLSAAIQRTNSSTPWTTRSTMPRASRTKWLASL